MYRLGNRKSKKIGFGAEDSHRIRIHDMIILKAIIRIGNKEAIKMSQLAQDLNITAPAVSQLARRLERHGYINRIVSEEDRRIVYIEVSDRAKNEMRYAEAFMNHQLDEIYEYLGEADTDDLIRILEKILLYFEKQERK